MLSWRRWQWATARPRHAEGDKVSLRKVQRPSRSESFIASKYRVVYQAVCGRNDSHEAVSSDEKVDQILVNASGRVYQEKRHSKMHTRSGATVKGEMDVGLFFVNLVSRWDKAVSWLPLLGDLVPRNYSEVRNT